LILCRSIKLPTIGRFRNATPPFLVFFWRLKAPIEFVAVSFRVVFEMLKSISFRYESDHGYRGHV